MRTFHLFFITSLALSGCTLPVGGLSFASQKYFDPSKVDYASADRIAAKGSSTGWAFYIWDLQPQASLDEAIVSAVRSVNGDFMTDISITETTSSFILFAKKTLDVQGTVYKVKSLTAK